MLKRPLPRPPTISRTTLSLRAGDEEAVVALERVDDDLLDAVVGDEQAGAEDALVGDDEVVAELGADDGQRVEAVAALDRAPAS